MDEPIPIQTLTARFEGANTVLTMHKVMVVKDTKILEVFKLMYSDIYIADNNEYKGTEYFLIEEESLATQAFIHRLNNPELIDKAVDHPNRVAVTNYLDLFK